MTQARPYAGVDAADRLAGRRTRLLQAGLELMGRSVMPSELTVRGVCHEAGVATRYFYESFLDKDEFVGAVFDWVNIFDDHINAQYTRRDPLPADISINIDVATNLMNNDWWSNYGTQVLVGAAVNNTQGVKVVVTNLPADQVLTEFIRFRVTRP